MASTEATVYVHLDISLDGEPVTRVLEMPASMEPMDGNNGLHIHLHLDGNKLAKALLPSIVRQLPKSLRAATGIRTF